MQQLLKHLFKPQSVALLLALLALLSLILLSKRTTDQLALANSWLSHTHAVISRLDHLQNNLELAETARRAYYIVDDESYLTPYYQVREQMPRMLDELKTWMADNPSQLDSLQQLIPAIDELMQLVAEDIRNSATVMHDQNEVMAHAKTLIDSSRTLIEAMRVKERTLLEQRRETSERKLKELDLLLVAISAAFVGLLLFSFFTLYREILHRRTNEAHLRASQALAENTVRHLSLMGEMSNLLHASLDKTEAMQIVASFTRRLISSRAGALYLVNEAPATVNAAQAELSMHWGEDIASQALFKPEDCWALRRGEAHALDHQRHDVACPHIQISETRCHLCVPIISLGEKLGILYLENPASQPFTEIEVRIAGQIAVALASNRLRADLRSLSVRDPLTGLFNRRYMEESLEREIAAARRRDRPLGLVLIDLDNFKTFNDNFGHEAGDLVLRELGALLKSNSRLDDIACRYGGEEFLMIFPEVTPAQVKQLAEQIRKAVHGMQLQHLGKSLGPMSASFGLAFFPEHGDSKEDLLRAADQALYQAKHNGRDRIEVARTSASLPFQA